LPPRQNLLTFNTCIRFPSIEGTLYNTARAGGCGGKKEEGFRT